MGEPKECQSMQHGHHMCELKKQGCADEMQKIAANPKVKCGSCGAVADVAEHVCKPVHM